MCGKFNRKINSFFVTEMASPKGQSRVDSRRKKTTNRLLKFKEKYLSWKYARYLALDPSALPIVALLIVLAEAVINVLVIQHVPYTEIDWVAYMQVGERKRERSGGSIHMVIHIFSGM